MPPDHAERRQITILLCDLVGSVQLSETLDAEELRELIRAYQTNAGHVIHRHGGYVAQYLGDGILVYFGYPSAQEDDAERAVRTGLEIVDAIAKANAERPTPAPIQVRVSVHTGLGVAGEIGGSGRQEMLVIGNAPNIASRLNAVSDPNQVIVSDDTKRIVDGLFEFEALPPLSLKGVAKQFHAHRVLSRSKLRRRFDVLVRRGLGSLIGREKELLALRTRMDRVRNGEGQAVFITGEAGIGKSRLIYTLANEVATGMTVLTAHCSAYSQDSAFLPLVEMYEQFFDLERQGQDVDHLARALSRSGMSAAEAIPLLAPFLALQGSNEYPTIEGAGPKYRERLLDLLVRLLVGQCEQRPLLIVIEDLHWADPSTLEFIGSLIDAGATVPLMLLLTGRPSFTQPWGFRPYLTRLELSRLPEDAINRIIDVVTNGKYLPHDVRRQLLAKSDGVPLFVEEMTKAVVDSQMLVQRGDRYELNLPATLRDSLTARLDRLEAAKEVAQLASVIGRRFSYRLLSAVSRLEDRFLRRHLDRLVAAELVFREDTMGAETYAFKHALIQEAAYESLLRRTRQTFHQTIAETLRSHSPELGNTQPELLARHYEGAGLSEQALEYWLKAGNLAQRRSANFECIAHMRRALAYVEALSPGPQRLQAEMAAELALGPALMATQGWGSPEVEAACTRARELCAEAGNGEGLLAALWGLWTVRFVRGEHLQALEVAEAVLAMALQTGNRILRIVAHHGVGFTRYFMGDFESAREHGERAVDGFDIERERELVGMFQLSSSVACLTFLAQSLWFLGYPEQAEARQKQAFEICRVLANPVCTAYALGVGLYLPFAKQDTEAIRTLGEECRSISDKEGFAVWSAQARFYLGFVEVLSGDAERGLDAMKLGWEAFRRTGSNVQATQWWLMQAEALRRAGRTGDALEALESGARQAVQSGERAFEPELYRLQGELLTSQGSADEGERRLRQSLGLAKAQSARMLELRAAVSLGRFLAERGRADEARSLVQGVHAAFTEGFDSPDLMEARLLLDSLEA
jgi:class 3 adenylate cyclase/tetratricopeptide (TPR) repeat protein